MKFHNDYDRTMDRLYRFSDFEKRRSAHYQEENYNLKSINLILHELGNPQKEYPIIHVAGTKGKGSTVHYLSSLLEIGGIKTGATFSPQVVDERDRFYIGGRKVEWEVLLPLFNRILSMVEALERSNSFIFHPTVFDIYTATAFQLFKEENVGMAVVETGMGGRWDSTNVVNSRCSLITLIDYDHTDKLGSTLEKIAGEKAGIIKPSQRVYLLEQSEEVKQVVQEQCAKQGSELVEVANIKAELEDCWGKQPQVLLRKNSAMKLNLNLALTALLEEGLIENSDYKKLIEKVLQFTTFPGRSQQIDNLIFDGAHTTQSLSNLVSTINLTYHRQINNKISEADVKEKMEVKGVHTFFYCMYDKDVGRLLSEIPIDWELSWLDPEFFYLEQERVDQKYQEVVSLWQQRSNQTVERFTSENIGEKLKSLDDRLIVFTGSFRMVGWVLSILKIPLN